jgi:hypothetical protein
MRLWAVIFSFMLNIVSVFWSPLLAPSLAILFLVPGLVRVAMMLPDSWVCVAVVLTANFVLYYSLALWIVSAFRPATNWWPARRS